MFFCLLLSHHMNVFRSSAFMLAFHELFKFIFMYFCDITDVDVYSACKHFWLEVKVTLNNKNVINMLDFKCLIFICLHLGFSTHFKQRIWIFKIQHQVKILCSCTGKTNIFLNIFQLYEANTCQGCRTSHRQLVYHCAIKRTFL